HTLTHTHSFSLSHTHTCLHTHTHQSTLHQCVCWPPGCCSLKTLNPPTQGNVAAVITQGHRTTYKGRHNLSHIVCCCSVTSTVPEVNDKALVSNQLTQQAEANNSC